MVSGIGIVPDIQNTISIEALPSATEDIVLHSKVAVIKHFLIIMRQLFNSNIHFKVTVNFDKNMNEHCGLASNSMLSNAIYLFGNVLGKNELVQILDDNFVEEQNGFLVRDIRYLH